MMTNGRWTAVLIGALVSFPSGAHIKNEASQFPDIEYSDARFDIVMLVGAGIIPETPVFEPDKLLSRRELATWVALARGLGPGGETPDTDELSDAALAAGLVESLDGDATLGDLDALFFAGTADIGNPDLTPTKAEAAALIASHLESGDAVELLRSRGLEPGATGIVAPVETVEGHHGSVYAITVGDTMLPMDAHGRVANGPTDLLQWEGRTVRRSFVRNDGDSSVWTYLEARPIGSEESDATAGSTVAADSPPVVDAGTVPAPPADTIDPPVDRRILLALVAAVFVLGFLLFFRRRRQP